MLAGTGEAAPNAGSLQTHLLSLLPSVISVSFNPTGTSNELAATVHDIQDKLEAAKGLVRKASIGATPPTCTKRSAAASVQEGPVQAEKPGAAGAPSRGRESESDPDYLRTPSPLPRPRRSVMDAMSADRLATASSAEAESTAGKKLKSKKKKRRQRSVIKKDEDIDEGLTA